MEYWSIILSILVACLAIYYFAFKDVDLFSKHGILHIPPLPIFGNMAGLLLRKESIDSFIMKLYNIHPDAKYVGAFDFMTPVIVVRDPELIKQVAVKHFESFQDHRAFINEDLDPLFGKNLFSLRGEKWRDVRNLLSPAFTSSKMKVMFKLMANCAADFCESVAKLSRDKSEFELKDVFTRYTNDVIATCAFGISVNSMKEPHNEFYVYGKEATTLGVVQTLKLFISRNFPMLAQALRIKIVSKPVGNFFKNAVETTIKMRDEQNIHRPDMIQLMMESRGKREPGKELTTEDMVSQAFIFFFGGFDTVSTVMCFMAHDITVNPHVQRKLQVEIDKVFEDNNGELTYEAINGMEYLDAVLNESMRLHTVAVFGDRLCEKDYELPPALPGGKPFTVTKGMNVWFPNYALHHDPKYFDDPDTFKPERFCEDGKRIMNSGTYLPFGLGPRMCIGNRFALLECKVLICHLLARCDLKMSPKTEETLKMARGVFALTSENGFWAKIEPRKNPVSVSVSNGKLKT